MAWKELTGYGRRLERDGQVSKFQTEHVSEFLYRMSDRMWTSYASGTICGPLPEKENRLMVTYSAKNAFDPSRRCLTLKHVRLVTVLRRQNPENEKEIVVQYGKSKVTVGWLQRPSQKIVTKAGNMHQMALYDPIEIKPIDENSEEFAAALRGVFIGFIDINDPFPNELESIRQVSAAMFLARKVKEALCNPYCELGRRALLRRAGFDPETVDISSLLPRA